MKTILVTGDWQAGSQFGLFPRGFTNSADLLVTLNKAQEYLLSCYEHMISGLPPLDIVIFNGDIIDGCQPKSGGAFLCEQQPDWQVSAAYELARPLLNRVKDNGEVYCTEGTDYHDGLVGSDAELFAKTVGARPRADRHYAWDWLRLSVDGVLLDVAHHLSVFQRYRSAALDREIGFANENADWIDPPDAIFRSHTHSGWRLVEDGLQVAVSIPAFEVQTQYARRKAPNRFVSRYIGAALANIDPAWRKMNQNPVQPIKLLYEHPKIGEVVYGEQAKS
jgi:hypothetical protein